MRRAAGRRITARRPKRSAFSLGEQIDYKNVGLLRAFVSEQGKLFSRRMSRLAAKQQRSLARAVKNARILAILHFLSNSR